MKKKFGLFLSSPISGFATKDDYANYRVCVLELISFLKEKYNVCSEIESITSYDLYDTPEKSVEEDFQSIRDNEVFILLHPKKMQTSALIEFGYACALDKIIIIVANRDNLPFLALGYEEYSEKSVIIDTERLNRNIFSEISNAIDRLINK